MTALQSGWYCLFTQLSGWQHWAGTHSSSPVHEVGSPIVVGTGVSVGVVLGVPGEVVQPERRTIPPIRHTMMMNREECFMMERRV